MESRKKALHSRATPSKIKFMNKIKHPWKQKDSNLRTQKRPDLQSGAVAAWLCFQIAHRSFVCEEVHNNRLTVAYGPSVTLDVSLVAQGGLEPPTFGL